MQRDVAVLRPYETMFRRWFFFRAECAGIRACVRACGESFRCRTGHDMSCPYKSIAPLASVRFIAPGCVPYDIGNANERVTCISRGTAAMDSLHWANTR